MSMRQATPRGINFVYAMISALALTIGGLVAIAFASGDMFTIGWVFFVLGLLLLAGNIVAHNHRR